MKIKRTAIIVTVLAVVMALLVLIPTMVMPALAEDVIYANNTFESMVLGSLSKTANQGTTPPSLAKVVNVDGNRVIRLDTVPANPNDATEIKSGGGNVDKNIILQTQKVSYEDVTKVYLQAEYFISADAKGSVQSQFQSYTCAEGSTNWFSLYYLNLTTGAVRTDHKTSSAGVLVKDAWNTVTVVLDLDSGVKDIYVNHVHVVHDDTCKYTKLTLNENRWIIAKLNKDGSGLPDNFGGYILIDDAKIATCQESYEATLPATDENGGKLMYVEVTNSAGAQTLSTVTTTKYFNAAGGVLNPVYLNADDYAGLLAPIKGGSIRLTNAAGIRFGTQIDLDILQNLLKLKEDGFVADVTIGTLITPRSYVEAAGAFTVDALESNLAVSGSKYLDVKGAIGHYYGVLPGVTLSEGYDTCFVGSIVNVKLGNRDKDFSAIGYVKVRLTSGDNLYIYSYDYDPETIGDYSRSIKGIALAALADTNANWTDEERVLLSSFANGATALELNSSILTDVQYTSNEFFFRNASGVYCRLTYEGVNGWRLQANGSSYDAFDDVGAGQALAYYLGETVLDKTERLLVSTDGSKVTLRAENDDSSYVTLNYTGSFNIQFYTGAGKLVSNVNSISVLNETTNTSTAKVSFKGSLVSGEAVYGGGERFDVVNRRGTVIQLYTADGWNRGDTTYMAIPLFTTSRGAGMFVNRYENMSADFGKASSSAWDLTVNNELMDCYFYATGKISDALLGYTEISGHSSLPEEWAQGELICRYSPDMANFEDREEYTVGREDHQHLYGNDYNNYGVYTKNYADYKSIPNYTSYYVKGKILGTYTELSSSMSSTLYNLDTVYSDKNGTVAFKKSGGKYYAQVNDKIWATLAEADAAGIENYDMKFLFTLKTDSSGNATGLGNYTRCYYLAEDGLYYKAGAKGNPNVGFGVKTIVNNLINAGMKPTAMVMEPFGWSNISTNSEKYNELKQTVEWLEERGIKSMFYMGVASISSGMAGYKSEYQAWATLTYPDGTTARTYKIPKTSGTGTNPDVGTSATQQYLDITNPEAVDWYMNEIWGMMIDLGADGIKIDFCECMPDEGDYGDFVLEYDWYDDTVFEGDDVHHAYSTYFISLFYKSMLAQKAAKNIDDGFTVLSRGGGIGSQRNPYLWEGDQARTFAKIEDQLIALINSGISGVPFMTYDMAGYAYTANGLALTGGITKEAESEIFARAVEYTAFTSNIQTHGDVRHAYDMTEEVQQIYRNFTDLHEQLIPYIQKYSQVACDTGIPVVRHLVLHYQDDANVYSIENQYMFGDALLVAPILKTETTSRSVYLPGGTWLNLLTGETVTGGQTVTVQASLGQIPVFMKTDCSDEDLDLLADVFNGETWTKISGIQLDLENATVPEIPGDPWVEDPFED